MAFKFSYLKFSYLLQEVSPTKPYLVENSMSVIISENTYLGSILFYKVEFLFTFSYLSYQDWITPL